MIKFFRHIRLRLLTQASPDKVRQRMTKENPISAQASTGKRFSKYLLYAIGEIVLVMIGILLALEVNDWNEQRKERAQEIIILKNLRTDLQADLAELDFQINLRKKNISEYETCLEILSEKRAGSIEELKENLASILLVGGVSLNRTVFKNLETSGEIRLIRNQILADSIVAFYNTGYTGWESALRDYTRNITAPYFLRFDHLPGFSIKGDDGQVLTMSYEPSDFSKPERTLEDYRQDYFIINTIRTKKYNMQALANKYESLEDHARGLDKSILRYLKELSDNQ